jgi:hypothetical protein
MQESGPVKVDPSKAIADLRAHTLNKLKGGEYAQLVFLASTRDYNSMAYKHDGLAFRWGEEATRIALEQCHRQVFNRLAVSSLTEMLEAFEGYLFSLQHELFQLVRAWRKMQSYRMQLPLESNPYFDDLFLANMAATLEALENRYANL